MRLNGEILMPPNVAICRSPSRRWNHVARSPDKTIDYHNTPVSARYAPSPSGRFHVRNGFLTTLLSYLDFCQRSVLQRHGFPMQYATGRLSTFVETRVRSYRIQDHEIFSIDPIHAPTDVSAWQASSCENSAISHLSRNKIPLLNQSPFGDPGASPGGLWATLDPVLPSRSGPRTQPTEC